MAITNLWVESYRPKTVDEYVFRDEKQRQQIYSWISNKSIPHLLFSGSAGIGKTTLARVLVNELDINPYDVLEINASRTNSVDDVRDKITSFSRTIPFGLFKVVILDEADYLSPNAQAALRGVMEEYHTAVRFILTCNYPNRIIPAIHSRCQGFHIENVDKDEFTARVATILVTENIDVDLDTLDTYVKSSYPDLRKCINLVQMNSIDGKLSSPEKNEKNEADWRLDMTRLFKEGKITEARKLVCKSARPEEMEDIYRWLYDNLDLISNDVIIQEKAILHIKQGLVDHSFVADPEINLAATLIKISSLLK
jgi:replication factor C small subunit